VFVASWPSIPAIGDAAPTIALIADTRVLTTPKSDAMPMSSHRLLWEQIRAEIAADPFAIGTNPLTYLNLRARNLSIEERSLDRARFIDHLIVPAYQQSVARILIDAKFPLELHGRGWDEIDEFRINARGDVRTQQQLQTLVSRAAALIHPEPGGECHPIDASPRPVIRPTSATANTFIPMVQRLLGADAEPAARRHPPISLRVIQDILKITVTAS
jgi:hypothetical protein